MSLAATVSAMAAAGCTAQQIAAVVEAHEAAEDARRAEKRAKDAERQRRSRLSRNVTVTERDAAGHDVTNRDVADAIPLQKNPSPDPSKKTTPFSSELSVPRCESARRHQWPADFCERVWNIFPRKTEKKAGIEALIRLYRSDRVAWADVVNGVQALSGSDPQFVPALARWLRGERWKDERPVGRAPPPPPAATPLSKASMNWKGGSPMDSSNNPRFASPADALRALFQAWPSDKGDGTGLTQAYIMAIEGRSLRALEGAVLRLIRGEVDDVDPRFLPTPAQVGNLAAYMEKLYAPPKALVLPAPGDIVDDSPEAIARRQQHAENCRRHRFDWKEGAEGAPIDHVEDFDEWEKRTRQAAAKESSTGRFRLSGEAMGIMTKRDAA